MRLTKHTPPEKHKQPKNKGGFQRKLEQLETRITELSHGAQWAVVTNRPTCRTCSLWVQFGGNLGKCRRFPPQQTGREVDTDAEFWCGEYRA